MNLKKEKTFVMTNPDGVKKGLIGEIIKRFEQRGLKIVALEMFQPTREELNNHYPKHSEWVTRLGEKTLATYDKYGLDALAEFGSTEPEKIGPEIRNWLLNYMLSAPVVKIVVEGLHGVDMVRKIAGPTMPYLADMGTIRGDYSTYSSY